jgi:hypothetical protein
MPAQFLVQPREERLRPDLIPFDRQMPFGFERRRLEQHRATRVVVAHAQIEHRVVHRAVWIGRANRQVPLHACAFSRLVADVGVVAANQREGGA